jgi:hypothetical protein
VIVGTGVLDCPLVQKIDPQKTNRTPTDFQKVCRGYFASESITLLYKQGLYHIGVFVTI